MGTRDFESLKRRCLEAWRENAVNFEELMDEAAMKCSDEQWREIDASMARASLEEAGYLPHP
jgi:hypothetical protein